MSKETKVIIEAVINVLKSTTFRVDQIETAGRLKACVTKLEEVLEGAISGEIDDQQGQGAQRRMG